MNSPDQTNHPTAPKLNRRQKLLAEQLAADVRFIAARKGHGRRYSPQDQQAVYVLAAREASGGACL